MNTLGFPERARGVEYIQDVGTITMVTLPGLWPLPTQDDLPCDDGIPMETQRHKMQMDLLIDGLTTWLDQRDNGYVSGNMFIYFSLEQLRNQDFRGPDVFVVLNVPKTERKSWVVWQEGKAPDIVIELLSESTATLDKTTKKQIYQNQMQVSEYYWYDPFNPNDWAGFVRNRGEYEPIPVNIRGYLASPSTGLVLRRWLGDYRGVNTTWLRWANPDGEVLPTAQELAQQAQRFAQITQRFAQIAQQEAESAQQEAESAKQEAQSAKQEAQSAKQEAQSAKQEAQSAKQEAQSAKQEAQSAKQRADTAEQRADTAEQRADTAEQRADTAEQRAMKLAQMLQELGINLDDTT